MLQILTIFMYYLDAQEFSTLKEKQEFYQNMKSGAESGWDYSTKWFFKEDGSASLDLKDIRFDEFKIAWDYCNYYSDIVVNEIAHPVLKLECM